ncbi:hypothetical protein AO1008_10125 [Aspergillus oryzae 100-8]|uniref:Uncharacterized protein n=1 Tax=Aspergillus oryzae (strain 3.042) TaxID=1160506 RepID=I8A9D0_ASPO3|nr:hypothetical protein Ao3042_02126 [Aspergillus oryzae 3.042]KDE83558.1 hypothetical protein AO1008_10125 [Aspergillus oryzae 100-8]|eukprot:EIT81479.1 hypothetical protein Ao3042_02126 [Aspergillus oryzae 3.042]
MLESANTRSSRVSANPSQSSEIEKALKELKKTIAGQRSAATFVAVVRSPSLGEGLWSVQEEMNAKKIVLPLNHASADSSPAALQQLASDCSPATFGRGSQDILDPSFRQAGKMEPANVATTFHPADLRIITLIERILLPSVINGKENSMWGRAILLSSTN